MAKEIHAANEMIKSKHYFSAIFFREQQKAYIQQTGHRSHWHQVDELDIQSVENCEHALATKIYEKETEHHV